MAEAEEEFHKSISDLISTAITKGAKVPGGHRVVLMSNILWLVPNLPLNPVLTPCTDLPLEKECRIILGETPRSVPASHGALSSDRHQKPHVLVAKLFTIFTRTCSGSYTISWLECRQTNMFDAKTVILY